MLPSLALSGSTLDHFRKNIYRPRLCLLLLLVLLSPYNATQLASSDSEISVSHPAAHGWSVSIIDGLVIAAPPPAVNTSPIKAPVPVADEADASSKDKDPISLPSPAPASSASARSSTSDQHQAQPPPGSLFRLPKLSWGLLIDSYVLPAVLPLHLLWVIRLLGMAIEDGVVKTSLMGAKSRLHSTALPLMYLACAAILAVIVGQPSFVGMLKAHCETWRSQFGYETATTRTMLATKDLERSPLLKVIVMLEASTCLASLLSVLFKIQGAPLTQLLPEQVSLPSPSHAPSLIEVLPIPTSAKAALLGIVLQGPTPGYSSRRRPVLPPFAPRINPPFQHGASNPNGVAVPTSPLRMHEDPATISDILVSSPLSSESNSNDSTYSASSSSYGRRRAARLQGQSVIVSTRWLLETIVSLFDRAVGAVLYATVTLRLPTLSPTSLPPVLSLLSLRSELAALTTVWTRARNSVECLEFVRRRWGVCLTQGQDPYTSVHKPRAVAAAASGDYQWKSYEDVFCAICFEQTRPAIESQTQSANKAPDSLQGENSTSPGQHRFCRLDCGHELHDVCLVSWLTAQPFCPTCHIVLSFSPRPLPSSQTQQT